MRLKLRLISVLLSIGAVIVVGAMVLIPGGLRPSSADPAVGMKLGERFHNIHSTQLQLQCGFCHVQRVEAYQDPLAQVFNQFDTRACLSCHKEGGAQPFYGESWDKASVGVAR